MVPQPRHKLLRRRCGDDTSVLGLLSKDGSNMVQSSDGSLWMVAKSCASWKRFLPSTISWCDGYVMSIYEPQQFHIISIIISKAHQIMKSPETSSNPRNFDDQLMRMGTMPRYAKGQMPNFQESRWAAQHPRSLGTSWHLRPHFGRSIRKPLRFHIFVLGWNCLRL